MGDDEMELQLRRAVDKLNERLKDDDVIIFDSHEAQALREVAGWWIALRGGSRVLAAISSVLKWALVFAAGVVAVRTDLVHWIQSVVGGSR